MTAERSDQPTAGDQPHGRLHERQETGHVPEALDSRLCLSLFEASGEGIIIRDGSFQPLYINPAYERLLGYSLDELRHLPPDTVLLPHQRGLVAEEILPSLRAGRSWEGELSLRAKDGRSVTLWCRSDAVLDAEGRICRILGLMRDLTGMHAAEQAMRRQAAQFERVQRAGRLGCFERSFERKRAGEVWFSRGLYELLGLDPGQGRPSLELLLRHIHPEDAARVARAFYTSGTALQRNFDLRVLRADGAQRFAQLTLSWEASPLSSDAELADGLDGSESIFGILQDVTEHRVAEQALQASRRLLDGCDRGVLLVDQGEGVILEANLLAGELLGSHPRELAGVRLAELTNGGVAGLETAAALDQPAVLRSGSGSLVRLVSAVRRIELGGRELAEVCLWPEDRRDSLRPPVAARAAERARASQAGRPARPRARILMVDDVPSNRELLRLYLKDEPYQVVEAGDGVAALDLLERQDFDLVIMDMMLPGLDGSEVVHRLRRSEEAGGREPIPVLAVSARAFPEDVDRSLAAGCAAHLVKPVPRRELVARVRELLEQSSRWRQSREDRLLEASATPAVPPAAPRREGRLARSAAAPGLEPAISDISDIVVEVDPLVLGLTDRLKADLGRLLAEAEQLLDREDFSELANVAHAMKGISAWYGIVVLARLASDLERAAAGGRERPEAVAGVIARMTADLGRLRFVPRTG